MQPDIDADFFDVARKRVPPVKEIDDSLHRPSVRMVLTSETFAEDTSHGAVAAEAHVAIGTSELVGLALACFA